MANLIINKLYGIIGSSLTHSLSPLIHNYLFKKYKLNNFYGVFEFDESNLKEVINSIRTLNISGLNITFPFKEKLIPYLDKIDTSAQRVGAVNTIKNTNGKLIGYNTDIIGVRKTIQNRFKLNIKGKSVLMIGAGGAARACLVELFRQKTNNIIIVNRNGATARKLIRSCENISNSTRIIYLNINKLNNLDKIEQLEQIDILINSTSASPTFLKRTIKRLLKNKCLKNTKIFDLNYGSRALSKNQIDFPNRYVDGLYMLTAQAAASFKIWTGIIVEPDDIYKYVNRKLRDKKYA